MRRLAGLLFVVALAGCVSLGGTAPETLTPAPVPEPTPGPPPGIVGDRLVDAGALAATHTDRVTGRSYAVSMGWHEAGRQIRSATLRVQSSREYHFSNRGSYTRRETYSTTDRRYTRTKQGFRTWYERGPPVDVESVYANLPGERIERYLTAENSTVRAPARGGGYVVRSSDPPPDIAGVQNYTARAVVAPDGFVRRLNVSYVDSGEGVEIAYGFVYSGVGETTVDPPGWVTRWRARTDSTPSPTPSGSIAAPDRSVPTITPD